MKPIAESELAGKWLVEDGEVVGDETERRIWDLVENRFVRLVDREGGWVVLYQDPLDQSLWELSFPQGELQGGGPAHLRKVTEQEARAAYPEKAWS